MDDSTTKRCTKCGAEKPPTDFTVSKIHRDGRYPSCKACKNAQGKQHRADHRDAHRARVRAYDATHPEAKRQRTHLSYERNREQVNARTNAYRKANPAVQRKSKQKWIAAHRDIHLADTRRRSVEWRAANPEKSRNAAKRRIARVRGAEGSHTLAEWQALKAQYRHRCLCCGKSEPEIVLTEDHIIPVTKGGSDYISNIQPLCKHCNSSKRARTIDYRP